MTNTYTSDEFFAKADTNRDGKIDREEFQKMISKPVPTSTILESTTGNYLYGSRTVTDVDQVVHTRSPEETNRYLDKLGNTVYRDLNPIVRRAAADRPLTYERRVFIKYLQPPPVSQEPLIIKEVRPVQPPAPPPLIIREQPLVADTPPPIYLRERPPVAPARTSGQIITKELPPEPLPQRSVIIERYPPQKKPADIIIERWLPYGSQCERRTIVQPAPPAIKYPSPTHTVVVYNDAPSRIKVKLEKVGVAQENPDAYAARWGTSLLDPATIVQEARNAGVVEDITPPLSSSSIISTAYGGVADLVPTTEIVNPTYLSKDPYYSVHDTHVSPNVYEPGYSSVSIADKY